MGVINNVTQEIRKEGLFQWMLRQLDVLITRLTTGLNWNDLRALARGDEPRRPNPRLTVHSESFLFHIKPSYYHQAVTKIGHTFRLGLLSTYFFIIETLTGVYLMIFYAPHAGTSLRGHDHHHDQRALRPVRARHPSPGR
jgi:ubiquinol-cytochrome c reductase cytochrome b subunit